MSVTSYRLTGDWRHVIDDGLVDPDANPDEALPTGHVEFIPVAPKVAVSGSPDTAFTVSKFKALIAGGVLTDLQGREGVSIAGKIGDHSILWRAITHLEYRGQKIDYPTVEFTLAADARLTGIVATVIPGGPPTIYHPRIEALIAELEGKSNVGHSHQITDVDGLQAALEDAANSGGTGEGGGGTGGPVSWTQVTGKPTEFPPTSHIHPIVDVTGLQGALDAKVGISDPRLSDARTPTAHTHSWASLTSKPTSFPPEIHAHSITDVSGLQQALEDAANSGTGGGGDGSPVSWISVTGKPTTFPPEAHSHVIADTTGLQAALDAKASSTDPRLSDARTPTSHTHAWGDVTGKPTSFTPATHAHVIGDTTGLQAALDAKVSSTDPRLSDARTPTDHTHSWTEITSKPTEFPPEEHEHVIADVSGLQAALDAAASDGGSGTALTPGSVQTEHIADGAVTDVKIPNFSIGTSHIKAKNLIRPHLDTTLTDELDGLRTDVNSKVGTTDPRLSDARTPTAHTHAWGEVTGKPSTFPAEAHTHSWASLTGKPSEYPPAVHDHEIEDVNGLQAALDAASGGVGTASSSVYIWGRPHTNPTDIPSPVVGDLFLFPIEGAFQRYDGTTWEVFTLTAYPRNNSVKTASISDDQVTRAKLATAVRTELDGLRTDVNAASGGSSGPVSWTTITNKPTKFAPDDHTHTISDVVNLGDALDGKSNAGHTHGIADVSGLQTELDDKVDDTDSRLTDARTPTAHTHAWGEVTGKPLDYPPAAHGHQIAEVNGLQGALDGKVSNLGGITGAISITRAAYDALTTKDPTTIYAIREA